MVFDGWRATLLGGMFATIFLVLALTDLDRRLIPNRVVYPAMLLALAMSWGWPDVSAGQVFAGGLTAMALAAALVALSLPFGANAFGMGDVKMIVLVGLVVGIPSVLVGVVLATMAAGAAVTVLLALRLRKFGDFVPHGPFLALGAIVALFWGGAVWDWYVQG
jgi:prepilin signal peptidase PulO-like enzyme (type II secretory pathway)